MISWHTLAVVGSLPSKYVANQTDHAYFSPFFQRVFAFFAHKLEAFNRAHHLSGGSFHTQSL